MWGGVGGRREEVRGEESVGRCGVGGRRAEVRREVEVIGQRRLDVPQPLIHPALLPLPLLYAAGSSLLHRRLKRGCTG